MFTSTTTERDETLIYKNSKSGEDKNSRIADRERLEELVDSGSFENIALALALAKGLKIAPHLFLHKYMQLAKSLEIVHLSPLQKLEIISGTKILIFQYQTNAEAKNSTQFDGTRLLVKRSKIRQFRSIMRHIHLMKNLQSLEASGTLMEHVYNNWSGLNALTQLDLSFTNIRTLPESIGTLDQLTHLGLASTNMHDYPTFLKSLVNLEHLDISGANFDYIPDTILHYKKLRSLKLSIDIIPFSLEKLSQLPQLEELDLSTSSIDKIPSELYSFKALKHLNLCFTSIDDLSPELLKLEDLEYLDISATLIKKLPDWIAKAKNLKTIVVDDDVEIGQAILDSNIQIRNIFM